MGVDIKFSQSFFWLNSWTLANILQLGTQSFCDRFVDYKLDPGRRLYEQMVMAARCGVANIAEGTARHNTSLETEMRLLDVARASIDEVQGDFFNFLMRRRADVWSIRRPEREAIWQIQLDSPAYTNDLMHEAAAHIIRQKAKFDPWIENESPDVAANALLVLCIKLNRMLENQLQSRLEHFRAEGGFSENMTNERMQARRQQAARADAPACPKCGKPMLRRMQSRGQHQGREFWGCSDYPRCNGTRPA